MGIAGLRPASGQSAATGTPALAVPASQPTGNPASGEEHPLKKLSFIPLWVPQAQFAGYYVAKEKGIYKKYGLDVTIINGGPQRQASDYLVNHRADIVMLWLAPAIEMRANGVKLINIAQMSQRSALMLVAKKARGINTPQDINGKKVGLWDPIFQIQPKAFLKKYNLDVTTVRQSYSVNLFLRDGVDVASAMWYNEYHTILNSGLNPNELTTFFFYDHGLNFPEDGLYALEETCNKDPESSAAFVAASIAGWRYAFDHPEEALDITMTNLEKDHIPATRIHQTWMLNRMKELMTPRDAQTPMGELLPEDYYRVAAELKHIGMIKEIPDFHLFYRKSLGHDQK
ncbi:MAG: ABC transporter substrate-binding protein [Deltaproteobacteria bacterium]|nr:ABC transporter substrate-binding protein [Deltaproteobacteria bacterium]